MPNRTHRSSAFAGARSIEALVIFLFLAVLAVIALRKLGVVNGSMTADGEPVRCRPAVEVVPGGRAHDGHARNRGGAHVRSCTA